MNETVLESLIVRLIGDGSSYSRMLSTAERETAKVSEQLQFHTQRIAGMSLRLRGWGDSLLGIVGGFAAVAGIGAGLTSVYQAITRFAEAEQLETAFEALIGDAKRASRALAELRAFAAETPFEMPELMGAAKQMIAFGTMAEDIVPTMRSLGDVASALNIPLGQLTYLFGTLKASGRVTTVDMNQFAMRGIPIWKQLEFQLKKTNAEVREMVEKREIGFPEIEKAFAATEGPMARFAGGMEKQSRTLLGLFSTLKDAVGTTLVELGRKLSETFDFKGKLQGLIAGMTEVSRWIAFAADKSVEWGTAFGQFVNEWGRWGIAQAVAFLQRFVAENQKLVLGLGIAAGALFTFARAWALLKTALMTTMAVLTILKVDVILSTALWLVWKAALVVAIGTLLIYKAATALSNVFTLALAAGQTIAAAATTVLSAAVGFLTLNFAALILTMAAWVAVVAVVGAAVVGLVKTGSSLLDWLLKIPTTAGPIKAIGSMFGEWENMLLKVVEVAKEDLPMAFELGQKAFEVMVSQVKDLWPPLWTFMSQGFTVVATLAADQFEMAFLRAMANILFEYQKTVVKPFSSDEWMAGIQKMQDTMNKVSNDTMKQSLDVAGKRLQLMVSQFDKGMKESDATKQKKEEFAQLAKDIDKRLEDIKQKDFMGTVTGIAESVVQGATAAGMAAAATMDKEMKDKKVKIDVIPRFDQAAWGSVEMMQRLEDFRERIGRGLSTTRGTNTLTGAGKEVGRGIAEGTIENAAIEILKKIADNTADYAVVKPIDITDFGGDF